MAKGWGKGDTLLFIAAIVRLTIIAAFVFRLMRVEVARIGAMVSLTAVIAVIGRDVKTYGMVRCSTSEIRCPSQGCRYIYGSS